MLLTFHGYLLTFLGYESSYPGLSTCRSYPPAGKAISAALIMITIAVLSVCLTQRIIIITSWKKLTPVRWFILLVYIDSFLFVFSVGVISLGFGVNKTTGSCSAAIIMCIIFYETTKLIYILLVEKVRLVKNAWLPRRKDKLYLFNSFGLLVPYMSVCFLTLAYRFSYFQNGVCRIGMKKVALLPLITFDVVVNVYLTTLFLIPVIKISRGRAQESHQALRRMAVKTFFGSCATLTSSVANLTTLMLLKGEPGWVCLLLCNVDVLFSVVVLHAITNKDHQGSTGTTHATNDRNSQNNTAIDNHINLGTRRSSIAKTHGASVANSVFVNSQLGIAHEHDIFNSPPEKSIITDAEGGRSNNGGCIVSRNGRGTPITTSSQPGVQQTNEEHIRRARPGSPRRISMAVHIRPITEYTEYDSDGLDFVTSAQIAEDSSSSGEVEQLPASDEEVVGHNEKYEERVPHRLV
ncbi:hypothetical protein TWF730_003087 [Orbilia blumenaviensis]|uniref:Transmembrane protein n=1 Tax=Orbilia blumenaviensis TaxID=1796055 RepID=A0AAV9U5R8_9PEZI